MHDPAILTQAGRGHQGRQAVPFPRRRGRHRDAPRAAVRLLRTRRDQPLADGAGPVFGRDRQLARGPVVADPRQRRRDDPLAQVGERHNPAGLTPAARRFLAANPELETPFLVMDLDVVEVRYRQLIEALPVTRVLYAVKANPAHEVLDRLAEIGSSFDVASPGEIDRCLKLGIDPARLAFGNTIKKEGDIAYAHRCGVRIFTVDAEAELDKVIRQA